MKVDEQRVQDAHGLPVSEVRGHGGAKRRPRLLVTIAAALAFATCDGGDVEETAERPPRRDGVVVIEMNDEMRFVPERAIVAPGDTIEWINVGEMPHTSTAEPGAAAVPDNVSLPEGASSWDSGDLGPGERFRTVVEEEGRYGYVCTLHEALGMVGELVVRSDR